MPCGCIRIFDTNVPYSFIGPKFAAFNRIENASARVIFPYGRVFIPTGFALMNHLSAAVSIVRQPNQYLILAHRRNLHDRCYCESNANHSQNHTHDFWSSDIVIETIIFWLTTPVLDDSFTGEIVCLRNISCCIPESSYYKRGE